MIRVIGILLGCLLSNVTLALHLDIAISQEGGKLTTDFCSEDPADPSLECDDLPALATLGLDPSVLPIDSETGKQILSPSLAIYPLFQTAQTNPVLSPRLACYPPTYF